MLKLEQVSHQFAHGTKALQKPSLEFDRQAFTALIGPADTGKRTLLRVLNGLIRRHSGKFVVGSAKITRANDKAIRLARRKNGMVFQQFNRFIRLNALENVLLGRSEYVA